MNNNNTPIYNRSNPSFFDYEKIEEYERDCMKAQYEKDIQESLNLVNDNYNKSIIPSINSDNRDLDHRFSNNYQPKLKYNKISSLRAFERRKNIYQTTKETIYIALGATAIAGLLAWSSISAIEKTEKYVEENPNCHIEGLLEVVCLTPEQEQLRDRINLQRQLQQPNFNN